MSFQIHKVLQNLAYIRHIVQAKQIILRLIILFIVSTVVQTVGQKKVQLSTQKLSDARLVLSHKMF